MKKRHAVPIFLSLLSACGGDSTSAPVPERVAVSPFTAILNSVGETRQFTARVVDSNGDEMVGAAISWASSDPQVASVDATGLATALRSGNVSIRATAEGLTGSGSLIVDLVPRELVKVSGDQQAGVIYQNLGSTPTVEVRDNNGNPIEGATVTFAVQAGGGVVSPTLVHTGSDGRASTVWRMGCSNDNPQQLDAFAGGLSQTFTATVDLEQLVVCLEGLPRGRATLAYQAQLIAAGGTQGTLSWDLDPASDPLPTGLTLNPDGAFSGAPSEDGVFPFVARVQDGLGGSAAAPFVLNICEAPVSLPVGGTQVLSTTSPGGCGFLLPAGVNGDRYRIGLVYASSTQDSLDLASVTVSMEKQAGVPALSARLRRAPAPSPAFQVSVPSIPSRSAVSIQQDIDRDRATEAFHRRLRAAERKLFERLGPELRPLPDLRLQRAITEGVFKAPPPPAPEKMTFRHAQDDFESCEVERTARAVKIAENDLMVFYQDSIQNAGSPVSVANVRSMLDYYRDYGTQVIDSYFEGVPDTNGDGRTVVLVTPEAGGNTVAFVWSGDYLSTSSCPASNGMELVRFNRTTIQQMSSANPSYQALSALVHEMRHIKSLFNGVLRSGQYQPDWVEEGVAEIAGEVSSRLAWAATGGPAVGAFVGRGHWIASSPENWGVILKMARTVGYLGWQPNGVLETPAGGGPYQSSYGAGWHFHRWLGDAYGDAATPLAEAPLFAALNRVEGRLAVGGVEDATGKQWVELMEEYLAAILVNGVDAPLGPRTFTTYDFPGSVAGINLLVNYGAERPGRYPWPVNVTGLSTTAPFATASRGGTLGPSGIQVLDLTSDGSGLGLEVEVTASDQPVRVVVARIH